MIFLSHPLAFGLLFITSCLHAAQSAPATLQAPLAFEAHQEKLLLNPASYKLKFSTTSTGKDLWHRTLGGILSGVATGLYVATRNYRDPVAAIALTTGGVTIPILCLTFIPGSTKYDQKGGTWPDWIVITCGRTIAASIGCFLGFATGILISTNTAFINR